MESLNRRRGAVKGRLTKITTDLSKLEIRNTDVEVFEEYLVDIGRIESEYREIKCEILKELDRLEKDKEKTTSEVNDMFNEQDLKFSEISDSFILLRSELKAWINFKNADKPPPTPPITVVHSSKVQLPKLKIPLFTGNYEDYPSFIERFDALVHQNREITVIQKFQLLLDSLSERL